MKKYDKYKLSGIEWMHDIPEHWTVKKIKHICNINGRIGYRGYTVDDLVSEGEGAITLSPSNMYGMIMNYTNCSYLSWSKYEESPEIQINNGDVLFVKTGSTYGKSSIVANLPLEATINPQIVVLKAKNINSSLLNYFLQTCYAKYQVEQTVVGGTIPTISQEKINNYYLPVPPISEQLAIANYLDQKCAAIDNLIEQKQKLISLYEENRQSMINQAVTRGLNPNVKMKDSGVEWIGEIPEHWEVTNLKRCTKSVLTGTTPSTEKKEYFTNPSFNWFTPSDFDKRNILLDNSYRKLSELAVQEGACKVFPENSVLIVGIGATLGNIGYSVHKCSSNQQINAVVFDEEIYPLFGAYYLFSKKRIIKSLANAATLPILNQSTTKEITIVIPPINEQIAIIEKITKAEQSIWGLIEKLKTQITLYQEYKQSLIFNAVTGKIKVVD